MVVNPAASSRVWLLFFSFVMWAKRAKSHLVPSLSCEKELPEYFKGLLSCSHFSCLSLHASYLICKQTRSVGRMASPHEMRVPFYHTEAISFGPGDSCRPSSALPLSASSEEGISHTCTRNTSEFTHGVLPWITRPAPPCPRAAAEGHRRT